jgi:hypothetical protein
MSSRFLTNPVKAKNIFAIAKKISRARLTASAICAATRKNAIALDSFQSRRARSRDRREISRAQRTIGLARNFLFNPRP